MFNNIRFFYKMNEKENENIFGKTERNRPLSTYP